MRDRLDARNVTPYASLQRLGTTALAAVLCCCLVLPSGTAAGDEQPPNVVLIMADDLGAGDLGCYNADSKIPTPHMNRLAAEGMRFTDAHSPSAVCTPTRYALLTGRYAWRSRLKSGVLWGFSRSLIEADRPTLASLLKGKGYRTGGVGKWHLGLQEYDPAKAEDDQPVDYAKPLRPGPLSVGFDRYYGIPASLDMEPYVWIDDDGVVELPTEHDPGSKRVWDGGRGFWRAGPKAPSFDHFQVLPTIGRQAVTFIEATHENDAAQPFFLYVPLASPHTPWVPTEEYRGRSQAGTYGDFTHQTDAVIGDILKTLDRLDLADETLVIVTSDNGSHWPQRMIHEYDHRANGNVRGMKADIWEGGHRVPFLVRWPGEVAAGSVCDVTICLTDVFATLAEVVEVPLPADAAEDSFSLMPLLKDAGSPDFARTSTVHHSVNGTFAIRQGDWKLVDGNLGSGGFTAPRVVPPKADGPQGQLYNLSDDPLETTNLYENQPEVVAELTAALEKIRSSGRSRPAE